MRDDRGTVFIRMLPYAEQQPLYNQFDMNTGTDGQQMPGNGLWLKGDGRGHFTPVPPVESGFLAPRDVTGLALIKTPAGNVVLVANSGDSLQAFTIQNR